LVYHGNQELMELPYVPLNGCNRTTLKIGDIPDRLCKMGAVFPPRAILEELMPQGLERSDRMKEMRFRSG
jgi:hypothetical protein